MNEREFVARARAAFPVGLAFDNLGAGTTRILRHDARHVVYRRGASAIDVSWEALHAAYARFAGGRVSSSELRAFRADVFDSSARPAGHSCNCTFLLQLLVAMGVARGGVEGRGVRGDPFAVTIGTDTGGGAGGNGPV